MISAASLAKRQINGRARAGTLERSARADEGITDLGRTQLAGFHE